MSRLFIGQREIDYISDLTKEVIKDVAGQKIYYYTIREDLSNIHDVYEESVDKIFNPPIEIEALVEWQQSEQRTTNFGSEVVKTISVYFHYRDLLDRGIVIKEGDFFSYGALFFEISSAIYEKLAFGQIERIVSIKAVGKQTRLANIMKRPIGPTEEEYSDSDSIQTEFKQQRGQTESDKRQLVEDGVLEKPISGPKKVAPDGTIKSVNGIGSSFYGDE